MEIIEYFTTENQEHWLSEIGKSVFWENGAEDVVQSLAAVLMERSMRKGYVRI